jgi:hypothetical protein
VRQQGDHPRTAQQGLVDERSLGEPVVARLMVFDALVADAVAQGQQKVVFAVVCRPEQRRRLLHELAKLPGGCRGDLERSLAVRGDVQRHGGRAAQIDVAKMTARDDGRVDQGGERDRRELCAVAGTRRSRQGGPEPPSHG